MQVLRKAGYVPPQLELSFEGYHVNGASVGYGRDGTKFAFTIGPISDATVAALEGAARNQWRLCLSLPKPLLLDFVALEHTEPDKVRIVGRIVGATSDLVEPPSRRKWLLERLATAIGQREDEQRGREKERRR